MANAACLPTGATTSTTSRKNRRSRRCATCCGTVASRRARSSASCSRSWRLRASCRKACCASCGLCRPPTAMDTLRTLVSSLSHFDPGANDMSPDGRYRTSVTLDGAAGHAWSPPPAALATGGGIIAPDPALGHAANFLYMLTGKRPSEMETRAFDVALVLHADHEFNASTFAGRVAAATLTDVHSAITGAIGALKGPLHGGANTDVMNLLLEIGPDATDQKVEEIIQAKLARKEKIPGFGHRVYRTEDPRATHLRQISEELAAAPGTHVVRDVANHRAVVKGEKKLNAERRFLLCHDVLRAGHTGRAVHAGVCRQPHLRMDRSRARAVREQPADPPARGVHGPRIRRPTSRSTGDNRRLDSDGSAARSQLFHHRPHRSRQVDAGRSPARADRGAAAREMEAQVLDTWISSASAASRSRPTPSG